LKLLSSSEAPNAAAIGVVISPRNFPLAILCGMATAAVVGGNTVLLKPSNNTPVIAAELVRLCVEAGFPPGVFNLVTGRGSEVGERLIASPQIDFIAFTGSMEVGLHIWETAGRTPPGQPNLKKVICEMGGKNCLVVDSDADLDEAVLGILHSAFGFLGQKCSAPSRLVVLEDNYDKLVERIGGVRRRGGVHGHDSSFNPLTRWNSRTLFVTSVRPPATACPAMSKS
jgi:acyl-CoA reductase-like NAD-dependent aldehyde dehydrogenase